MQKYDVIIIGAGLGGLQCAYTLSKTGHKVLVLEQGVQIGGCLQNFRRGNALFDTGFHYVGGLDVDKPLYRLFNYYNLLDLPWVKLDEEFDHIVIGGHKYAFAQGHDQFVERLVKDFPNQKDNIKKYSKFLQKVGDHIFDSITNTMGIDNNKSLFARSAYEFLNETIKDEELKRVLSGTSLKMQLDAETLPLYVFAQINNSFIDGAYRMKGGGHLIADKLAASIVAYGGEIRTNQRVTNLIESEGKIIAVEVNSQEQYQSEWVISDVHPIATLDLLKESKCIRKIYRNRINNMQNSYGAFTVNIKLKPDTIKYKNSNLFIHDKDVDMWRATNKEKIHQALISWGVPDKYTSGQKCYANVLDIVTPMSYEQVAEWGESKFGHRPIEYKQYKLRKAEELINFVSIELPELRESIDTIYTSTPLSYIHYTSTAKGSAYGVMKNWQSPMTTVLTPKTPISNLLLTGQNLNLHGILGVTMTSLFTCAEIIGKEKIIKELKL